MTHGGTDGAMLPGYDFLATLHAGPRSRVVRARRASDGRAVVIKIAPPGAHDRLAREHLRLVAVGGGGGVVRALGIERVGGTAAIVLEDVGGEPLADRLAEGPMDVDEVLHLGARVAEAIAALHGAGFVHGRIAPDHVVVARATGAVRLVGIGGAAPATRARAAEVDPAHAPYAAPELLAPTGRPIDRRADLHALGAVLYRAITGRPPYPAAPPAAIARAAHARPPAPPHEIDPATPRSLSLVVMKLLAADPADRYQSVTTVLHDLAACHEARSVGERRSFRPAPGDVHDRVERPARLYGRAAQVAELVAALERVRAGEREMVVVRGRAGAGKRALVGALRPEIARVGGLVGVGVCDPDRRGAPGKPVVDAVRAVVRAALAEEPAAVAATRRAVARALGDATRTFVARVPELAALIGEAAPEPPDVGLAEARVRWEEGLAGLLGALATPERPVVIVVAELHAADAATIAWIGRVATRVRHALVVATFRDAQIDPGAPLRRALAAIEEAGVRVTSIAPPPLTKAEAIELYADATGANLDDARPMATLCAEHAGYGALFLVELLAWLGDRGVLSFDADVRRFRWDLEAVERALPAGDLVDLVAARCAALPRASAEAIAHAAIVGPGFTVAEVAAAAGRDAAAIDEALEPALAAGLAHVHGGGEAFALAHEVVGEAALRAIGPAARAAAHLRVARAIGAPPDAHDDHLFAEVRHLAIAREGGAPVDPVELARLHLAAAERALAGAAPDEASEHAEAGLARIAEAPLPDDDLARALHVVAAEAHGLAGERLGLDRHLDAAVGPRASAIERVRALEVRMDHHLAQGEAHAAIEAARAALALLGGGLDAQGGGAIRRAAARLGRALGAGAGPVAQDDPRATLRARLLARVATAALDDAPTIAPAIADELRFAHDARPEHAVGIALAAALAAERRGDVAAARMLGERAMARAARSDAAAVRGRVRWIVHARVEPHTRPLRAVVAALGDAAAEAIALGDLAHAAAAAVDAAEHALVAGCPVAEVVALGAHGEAIAERAGSRALARRARGVAAVARAVGAAGRGGAHGDGASSTPPPAEAPAWEGAHDRAARALDAIGAAIGAVLAGAPLAGLARLEPIALPALPAARRALALAVHALAELAAIDVRVGWHRRRALGRVDESLGRLAELARAAPASFAAWEEIVRAERARRTEGEEAGARAVARAVEVTRAARNGLAEALARAAAAGGVEAPEVREAWARWAGSG